MNAFTGFQKATSSIPVADPDSGDKLGHVLRDAGQVRKAEAYFQDGLEFENAGQHAKAKELYQKAAENGRVGAQEGVYRMDRAMEENKQRFFKAFGGH